MSESGWLSLAVIVLTAVIVIEAIEINRIKKTLDANGIPVAPVVII